MTTRHDDRGIRAREEVAHVCAQVDYIRTTLETYGAQGAAPLEHLLSALREGQDPAASLDSSTRPCSPWATHRASAAGTAA